MDKIAVRNLFHKYERELGKFGNDLLGTEALRESLELIGNGEILEKEFDRFMYSETIKDKSFILIVHASYQSSPYGGSKGYNYEIGIYRDDPKTEQIGGGYGTQGTIIVKHTQLFGYIDFELIHFNKNVISKVVADVKEYVLNNFQIGNRI